MTEGHTALVTARAHKPNLMVLDVMPDVCRQLRQFSDAYVVMPTARVEELDKIVGLSVDPDDYVTRALARRAGRLRSS